MQRGPSLRLAGRATRAGPFWSPPCHHLISSNTHHHDAPFIQSGPQGDRVGKRKQTRETNQVSVQFGDVSRRIHREISETSDKLEKLQMYPRRRRLYCQPARPPARSLCSAAHPSMVPTVRGGVFAWCRLWMLTPLAYDRSIPPPLFSSVGLLVYAVPHGPKAGHLERRAV